MDLKISKETIRILRAALYESVEVKNITDYPIEDVKKAWKEFDRWSKNV